MNAERQPDDYRRGSRDLFGARRRGDVRAIGFGDAGTVSIEDKLRSLTAPALIVWGDDDVYFDVKWAKWLAGSLSGARHPVVLKGARIFFPEERADQFNQDLRAFWT